MNNQTQQHIKNSLHGKMSREDRPVRTRLCSWNNGEVAHNSIVISSHIRMHVKKSPFLVYYCDADYKKIRNKLEIN